MDLDDAIFRAERYGEPIPGERRFTPLDIGRALDRGEITLADVMGTPLDAEWPADGFEWFLTARMAGARRPAAELEPPTDAETFWDAPQPAEESEEDDGSVPD